VTAVGGGSLLVAGQDGRIWEVTGAGRLDPPVLDISSRTRAGGERGLLGIAVHPLFPSDARVFVDYTGRNGDTVVAWFPLDRVGTSERLAAEPAGERVVLRVAQPFANHNGGAIAFGPDGFLYVALGDGGSSGDPQGNGQRLDTLLGTILRLDVRTPGDGAGYGTPTDNPFADRPGARPEIWTYGLRNPWRFSFDRATADLWIGDVGQSTWEEIDVLTPDAGGRNLGWNVMEGRHCYPGGASCDPAGLVLPVAEYRHGPGCSVTGGVVYRGRTIPGLAGRYLFADYCSGAIMAIPARADPGDRRIEVILRGPSGPAGFGEDAEGGIYLANVAKGTVSRIVAAP
jgi:glucose/arabinose dehydrogenase